MYGPVHRVVLLSLLSFGPFASLALAQTPATAPSRSPSSPAPVASPSASSPLSHPAAPNIMDANRLLQTGELNSAIDTYNQLIATGTEPALAYAGLARAYLKRQRVSDAYAAATKAFDLAPSYPAVRTTLAEVWFRQGRLAEAEKEFVALIRSDTPYPRAYLGMARISQAASYYKQAKRLIDIAHERDPEDPDITEFWLHTLSPEDRIKALRGYLGSSASDVPTGRAHIESELAFLQEESGQPAHPCRLATKVTSMETDLKHLLYDPQHLRGYGLNVKLNGATSAALMLDTGAGGIVVDRKVAEKAGIRKVAHTTIGGIGDKGDAQGYVGYADSIKIGTLEFQDCFVEVVEKKGGLDDNGLIGADVFSHFLVDLDFSNGKFRLSELPRRPEDPQTDASLASRSTGAPEFHDRYIAPEMKSYTPVYRFGHMLLLWTQVTKAQPKLFLLDTGSFANTISPAAAREVTKIYSDSDTTVKGLSGKVNDVFRANDVTLIFGHLRQENQDIVSFDTTPMSDSAGTEVSGMLGFTLLRMLDIRIDYRDGLVDLQYDKNRWH